MLIPKSKPENKSQIENKGIAGEMKALPHIKMSTEIDGTDGMIRL